MEQQANDNNMTGRNGIDLESNEMERVETTSGTIRVIKAPYGKLEETGPPESYIPDEPRFREYDSAEDPREDSRTLGLTVMPWSADDVDLSNPDGYTIWIFRGKTRSKALRWPGSPQSVPKIPHPTPSCEVRNVQGMGKGLFATRDLEIGELIFVERPLLIAPRTTYFIPEEKLDGHDYTMAQVHQIRFFEAERHLRVAVRRMTKDRQRAYLSLANSHKEDGSGLCFGILRTNIYAVENLCDGPDGTAATVLNGYGVIGDLASRINHSCISNVSDTFDVASFSLQFYAKRKIKVGEQLFYCYHGDSLSPIAQRQKALEPYGIICKCQLCANATPESERRLKDLISRRDFVCAYVAHCLLKPYVRKRNTCMAGIAQARELEVLIKMLEDLNDELDNAGQHGDEPSLVFLHKLYLRAGKLDKACALAKNIVRYSALYLLLETELSE